MISKIQRILFLTTRDPATIRAEWPYYQNWTLPECMAELGAEVEMLCWRDTETTVSHLVSFDKICFLWCNNYHEHGYEFATFLKERLIPAQAKSSRLQVLNSTDFVLWNMDKAVYLPELDREGFSVPRTSHIDLKSMENIEDLVQAINRAGRRIGTKVVLKPAISGSSKLTHLVLDTDVISSTDEAYLEILMKDGLDGSLIVQAFEPAIATGEYSLVFIDGKHTHTMLKTPASGEFKCQAEFGGGIAELSTCETPKQAVGAAQRIIDWLGLRFGTALMPYCRIDGVMSNGEFVLMEVEGIEPHLWLETCVDQTARERLYEVLLH